MAGACVGALADRSGEANLDETDGYIGDQTVTVLDQDHPAIARLDPDLIEALRDATRDAQIDGIQLRVNSGWRSMSYQEQLLDDATDRYGSRAEARRWVATPQGSSHVSGDAVDVGPTDAAYWLNDHGADYGLCQAYANEIWHYELLTHPGGACPIPRMDAAD